MTLLQVALDFDNEKKALDVARKVRKHVDIFEAGTPLIKADNEARIIKKLKKIAGKKKIFADLKTMDTGFFEAKHASNAGADYVSVLGVASDETIKGAMKASGKKDIVVDLIGCRNAKKRVIQLRKLGVKNFEVHTAIDEQKKGKRPFRELLQVSKQSGIRVWVAGGINLNSLEKVMKHKPHVVVVGGAITKAKDPEKAARLLKEKLVVE